MLRHKFQLSSQSTSQLKIQRFQIINPQDNKIYIYIFKDIYIKGEKLNIPRLENKILFSFYTSYITKLLLPCSCDFHANPTVIISKSTLQIICDVYQQFFGDRYGYQ